jgi:alpha-L-arabinofuranosidase
VNLASLSGYQTVVSIAGTNVAGFFLQLRGDTGTFAFSRLPTDADGTATYVSAPTAPVTGTWYHIVGVADAAAGTITLYVDGQSMGSTTFNSGWAANGNTLIGHGLYSGGQVDFVNGSIDDVELFSSALSAAQVAALDQPAAYQFDEGTGTTAADSSGHGNTLTLGSGASWAAGKVGPYSLALNGSATGNATFASPVINTALPFSVSAWMKLNSLSGYQSFVSIDGAATSGFYLQFRGDTGKFAFTRLASDSVAATAYHADATSAPSTGVWYNLIGVNDVADGQLLLYVNGVLQSTVSYSGGWQATGATIVGGGKFNGARSDFVNGDVDDVHFYDSTLSATDAAFIGTGGNSVVTIATGSTGATVSPNLFGAFMEDINYGGEGGIYNDEVRNSGFNDSTNALNDWSSINGSGVVAALTSDTTTGPTAALSQSGKLQITSGISASARAGISNSGYFGVALAPSTSYSVQFYAKATSGFTGPLSVDLESNTGTVYSTATISSITSSWAQYTATLTTGANTPTTSTNRFVISTNSASANGATIWFGATYLYPPSYNAATNHLRIDLMQMLAALKPAIFRVPGGNYLEGNTYSTRFEWSNTVGPVQNRPGHFNSAWGYWSTDGMGLDEYLQMAEEVGASQILAVYAGYTLNGSSDTGTTLSNDVTDAVNELHYVLDPTSTTWGAERAANGHPTPYNVNYVEIGNEDFFSSTYPTRYPLFYNAIHAAFPSLKIIATSSSTGGSPYDVLDEHFYEPPQWFEANSGYFDAAPRGSNKIFIGEYASNQGSPTNNMESALGDASWLLGLERNSDLVTMSSYAPLWVNVNGHQWNPDLIGFNGTTSYGSPSYYAQVMLSQNHGSTVVSDTVSGASGLRVMVTRTGTTYYLTVVNTVAAANMATVNLSGVNTVSSTATVTSLTAPSATSTNSITNPTNIAPVTFAVSGLGTSFNYTFPGYSITILKFGAGQQTATSINVSPSSQNVPTGKSQQFTATVFDQFGNPMIGQTPTWSVTGAGNFIDSTGLFTAGASTGLFSVKAALGGAQGAANVTVIPLEVTNTNDSGAGSLRQALIDTGLLPGQTHTVQFMLPIGPQTINLLAALPTVPDPLVVSLDATQSVTVALASGTVWSSNTTLTIAGAGILTLRGGIVGTGKLTVTTESSVSVSHLIQNALVISGTAGNASTVTIGASDASGNPLATPTTSIPGASTDSSPGSSSAGALISADQKASTPTSTASRVAFMTATSTTGSPPPPNVNSSGSYGSSASNIAGKAVTSTSIGLAATHSSALMLDVVANAFEDRGDLESDASIPVSLDSATDAKTPLLADDMLEAIGWRWRN